MPSIADSAALPSRAVLQKQFVDLLDGPVERLTVVALSGASGVGKSQVLALLEAAGRPKSLCLDIYDFFFVDNFKPAAIEVALIEAVEARRPSLAGHFAPYFAQRDRLSAARDTSAQLVTSQERLRNAFVAAYNRVAEEERAAGRPVVLLFDSIEYATELSDNAAHVLLGEQYHEPHWGGEHWLRGILPQLANTIAVCSGRASMSAGVPVTVVERIARAAGADPISLSVPPLTETESRDTLRAHYAAVGAAPPDEAELQTWHAIAQGLPFWLAMLATARRAGTLPAEVAGAPAETIGDLERAALRERLMRATFLPGAGGPSSGLATLLAQMAWLRKGLTPELLKALDLSSEARDAYATLPLLPIVREHQRTRPYHGKPFGSETLYFLHEEVYSFLDGIAAPPPELMAHVVDWYNNEHIPNQNNRRAELSEEILDRDPRADNTLLEQERDQLLVYRQLLDLDRLFYYFQLNLHEGLQSYNLVAYNAIVQRQYGHNLTVRQEGLRNLYRHYRDGLPMPIEVECAARWVLRAAHVDPEKLDQVLIRLRRYDDELPQLAPQQRAFLKFASGQALMLRGAGSDDAEAGRLLLEADQAARAIDVDLQRSPWDNLLKAQIAHWLGLFHSRQFSYQVAAEHFRRSYGIAKRWPLLSRGLQAQTLSELALAYAEQGDSDDGRLVGERALQVELRLGSPYYIAKTFAVLARIETRGGRPGKCLEYAQRGDELMVRLENPDGQLETMLVLAEAYRKAAEDLDYDRYRQGRYFDSALATCDRLDRLVKELGPRGGMPPAMVRCQIDHLRGAIFRSRGLVQARRHPSSLPDQIAGEHFAQARRWLGAAYETAVRNHLPPLVCTDIAEDLAAVAVHEERFDQTLLEQLNDAESHVPDEYWIREERGLPDVPAPIIGYWRELGQCQLQRMMLAFGTFERGATGPRGDIPPRTVDALQEAGHHMQLMFGYLLGYARSSWMLQRAEQLTLRELERLISLADDPEIFDEWLDEIVQASYETGKTCKIAGEAQTRVETLVKKIRRDRDFRSAR